MPEANPWRFLTETYDTERLKTLSVWSAFREEDLRFRCAERARTPLEHMVHQCVSEDTWLRTMLGLETPFAVLPSHETRLGFLLHYAAASSARLARLVAKPADWWAGETRFFDVTRSRAWVFVRRIAHSSHHRGQMTVLLRLLGRPVYSTYGPSADTGGLFMNHPPTVYRYDSVEALLAAEAEGGAWPSLPGPGEKPVTERP
ncbi:MAG TPA: DinB family protein [Candidatus Eisenbacteria bacterium]